MSVVMQMDAEDFGRLVKESRDRAIMKIPAGRFEAGKGGEVNAEWDWTAIYWLGHDYAAVISPAPSSLPSVISTRCCGTRLGRWTGRSGDGASSRTARSARNGKASREHHQAEAVRSRLHRPDFAVLAAALREEITQADRIRRRKLTLPLREVIPASFTGRPWVWALLTVAQLPAVTGWGKATLEDYLKGQAAVPFPPHTAEIGRRGNLYAAGDVACFAAQLAPAMRHDRGLNLEQREEIRRLRATGMGPAEIAPMFGLKNANTVYDIVHRRRSYADDVPAAAAKLPGTPPRGWTAEEEGLIRGLAMVNMFRDLIRADPRTVITEAKTAASAAGLPGRSQSLAAAWLEARYWEAPHLISRCESMRNDGLVTSREAAEGFGDAARGNQPRAQGRGTGRRRMGRDREGAPGAAVRPGTAAGQAGRETHAGRQGPRARPAAAGREIMGGDREMKYGYARCSTSKQDLEAQVTRLRAEGCERIFSDFGVSGTKASQPASRTGSPTWKEGRCAPATSCVFTKRTGIARRSIKDLMRSPTDPRAGHHPAEFLERGCSTPPRPDGQGGLPDDRRLVAELQRDLIAPTPRTPSRSGPRAGAKAAGSRSSTAEQQQRVAGTVRARR